MIEIFPRSHEHRVMKARHRIHEKIIAKLIGEREKGFDSLLMIHEERMSPGVGAPLKNWLHCDCVRLVLKGSMSHQDQIGNLYIQKTDSLVAISTGSGMLCQAYNASDHEEVHFIEIWLKSANQNAQFQFQSQTLDESSFKNRLEEIASGVKSDSAALKLFANAAIFFSELDENQSISYALPEQNHCWLQLIEGEVQINDDKMMHSGEAAAISKESNLSICSRASTKFLLIKLFPS